MVADEPGVAKWRFGKTVALEGIGTVLMIQRDLDGALLAFARLSIFLADLPPSSRTPTGLSIVGKFDISRSRACGAEPIY